MAKKEEQKTTKDKKKTQNKQVKTEKPKKEETKKVEKGTKEKEETKKAEKSTKQKVENIETLQKKESAEIEEAVGKEIKANRKLSEAEFSKINTRVFQNIGLAVIIMFYLNFVVLGFMNIEQSVFLTDLKVFSMTLLVVSIAIFEHAYKKDNGRYAIHGIEILLLAFITMALVYTDLMWKDKFIYAVALITYIYAIYYVAKAIIVYHRMKKEYFISEMKKIIKK